VPNPLINSTVEEMQPTYDPGGKQIAFVYKTEGGPQQIWLADADGSNRRPLTRGPGSKGWPGWSPDGRTIVFDLKAENGHVDVWTIDVDGSKMRQVTHDPADSILPSWSRDGRFIYFTSSRTGGNEIWRVPSQGGLPPFPAGMHRWPRT